MKKKDKKFTDEFMRIGYRAADMLGYERVPIYKLDSTHIAGCDPIEDLEDLGFNSGWVCGTPVFEAEFEKALIKSTYQETPNSEPMTIFEAARKLSEVQTMLDWTIERHKYGGPSIKAIGQALEHLISYDEGNWPDSVTLTQGMTMEEIVHKYEGVRKELLEDMRKFNSPEFSKLFDLSEPIMGKKIGQEKLLEGCTVDLSKPMGSIVFGTEDKLDMVGLEKLFNDGKIALDKWKIPVYDLEMRKVKATGPTNLLQIGHPHVCRGVEFPTEAGIRSYVVHSDIKTIAELEEVKKTYKELQERFKFENFGVVITIRCDLHDPRVPPEIWEDFISHDCLSAFSPPMDGGRVTDYDAIRDENRKLIGIIKRMQ